MLSDHVGGRRLARSFNPTPRRRRSDRADHGDPLSFTSSTCCLDLERSRLRLRDRAMLSVEQDTLAKAVEDVGIGRCGQERRSEAGEKKAQRHRSIH